MKVSRDLAKCWVDLKPAGKDIFKSNTLPDPTIVQVTSYSNQIVECVPFSWCYVKPADAAGKLFATPTAWHGIVNHAQVPPVGLTCSIRLTSQPTPICSLSVVHMECEHVGNNSPQLSHECVRVKWVPLLAFSAWYTYLLNPNVPVLPSLNRCLIVSLSETLNNY